MDFKLHGGSSTPNLSVFEKRSVCLACTIFRRNAPFCAEQHLFVIAHAYLQLRILHLACFVKNELNLEMFAQTHISDEIHFEKQNGLRGMYSAFNVYFDLR